MFPRNGASASGRRFRALVPGLGRTPTAEEINDWLNKQQGRSDTNAPADWGWKGKVLDTATESVVGGALLAPLGAGGAAASVVRVPGTSASVAVPAAVTQTARSVVPSAVSGGLSETAGQALKGTPYELPGRLAFGALGGSGASLAQNVIASPGKLGPTLEAARRLGESVYNDGLRRGLTHEEAMAAAVARHGEFLPGTPLAYTLGPDARGTVRGAFTAKGGSARAELEEGANKFIEGGEARVEPVLQKVSPLPVTREADLRAQAQADAPPIYQEAGVANRPQQTIMPTQEGPVPAGQLGPGAPVTPVTTNSLVLSSPDLVTYMGKSADIKAAIKDIKGLPSYADEPVTSMAFLDKVYKRLGDVEASALKSGHGEAARDARIVRQEFLDRITAENPKYAEALKAYADPSRLANAYKSGYDLMKKNAEPQNFGAQFRALSTPEEKADFAGGVVKWMREAEGSSGRATPSERIWNTSYRQKRVAELFKDGPDEAPSELYGAIHAHLQKDKEAARNMRDIIKGSSTANKLAELDESARTSLIEEGLDVARKGIWSKVGEKVLDKVASMKSEAARRRAEEINAELARLTMQTDPTQIIQTQGLVATARQQAEAQQAARAAGWKGAGAGTATSLLGPADRIMHGLLGGP